MKMEPKFFGRKGKWYSHQRCIQNPVKHRRWNKKRFAKKDWKRLKVVNYFYKKLRPWCLTGFWISLWSLYRENNVNQLFLHVIYHLDSNYRPYRHFCNSCIDTRAWGCSQNDFLYTLFYQDSFHKDQKSQKLLKSKTFFRIVQAHHFPFRFFLEKIKFIWWSF